MKQQVAQRELRKACRKVYASRLGDEDVAAAFGDALAFYSSVEGLGWHIASCLAEAGYFYPNEVADMTDGELLAVKGLGHKSIKRLRSVFGVLRLPTNLSTSQLLDSLTKESLPLPAELPHKRDLIRIDQGTC